MSATLKKITARAKQIRKSHPSMKWTSAIKQASAELKRSGAIGVTAKPKRRSAGKKRRSSKKRVGAYKFIERNETKSSPVKKTYRVSRSKNGRIKSVSKVAGIGRATESQLKGVMIGKLEQKLGELHVKRERNTKAKTHHRLTKQITEVRRKIRMYK
jgi:hypothetical protein